MVYKPCPQCGNSNHHNKVKCAECGVCLRARPGRPKKISDDKNKKSSPGRPCIQIKVLCPSCGHCNDLCRVSKCSICDESLVGKGGRLEEISTVCCPSCGHMNEAKRTSCSVCAYSLTDKGGRPEAKSTIPCPSCGHLNEVKRISCSECECALISKGGLPELKSTTPCPSCGK